MTSFFSRVLNVTSSMESICGICEKQVNEGEEDNLICDLCNETFNMHCGKSKKSEIKARKNSSCIKIFCPKCIGADENVLPAKLNDDDIMTLMYKLDMSVQQQKAGEQSNNQMLNELMNVMKNMVEKVGKLDDRMQKVELASNVSDTNVAQTTASSFANIVKSGVPKSAVVFKPKQKQHSKKTMEQISNAVDGASINVCGTRNARDGGIVLCFNNTTDTMKVKEIVREKLGDGYDVTLPTIKNPRLRITNIATEQIFLMQGRK